MPQQASSDANTVSYRALEDLSHNAELAQAIGNMVITWARTEIEIFSVFARVAEVGLNMAMESYAHIPTFESRIKFTLALLNEWQTDEFDIPAIRREIEGLNGLIGTRNRWIHGDWCANADKSETVVFNHRRPSDHAQRRSPVKANDIKVHCEAVRTRARKLNELIRGSDLTP